MDQKKNMYESMIIKLELLEKQKKKLEFEIKLLKEHIDEYETNHLFNKLKIIKIFEENDDFM